MNTANIYDQLPEGRTLTPAQEGNMSATDLAMNSMREALLYTRECCQRKIPDDALVSLCYETMLKSAKIFKPGRLRFFSYAKARLRGALKRHWSSLKIVRNADTVSFNVVLDTYGSESPDDLHRMNVLSPFDSGALGGTVEPDFERIFMNDSWEQVRRIMLRKCTDLEKGVIFLAYKAQLSFTEIGGLLDLSRQFVSLTAQKGLKKIRRELKRN